MPAQRNHLLTITLTPDTVRIVEAKRAGHGVKVLRNSSLEMSDGVGLDHPAALGTALTEHLQAEGYSTRHAVIGLSSRWILARHKPVPPADADAMRGIVNLQIEREFAGGASEMTFDYTNTTVTPADGQSSILLAGVRNKILNQVQQTAVHAKLKLVGITPTAIAAASRHDGAVILIDGGVASVMRVQQGSLLGVASCTADLSTLANSEGHSKLTGDLSRALLQLPSGDSENKTALLLPTSIDDGNAQQLTDSLQVRLGETHVQRVDSAKLLAEHILSPNVEVIDFNDSRLAAPPPSRLSPVMQWVVRAAVVALLAGGTLGYLWYDAASTRDSLQADYDAIKDKAEELKGLRDDIRVYGTWYDDRPAVLECMLELTRTFPKEGEIRVKTLLMNNDMTGQIDCEAADRKTMDAYFTQMQQSKALVEVNRGGVRQSPGRGTSIDFPISFRFDPSEGGGQP